MLLLIFAPFVGSFLGVVIERLPEGRGLVFGRSRCDTCRTPLGARDLIPFASWIASRGRCRHCGAHLGWFYPGIELSALVVAAWAVLAVPPHLAWATAGFGWTLLALAEIDRRHFLLPDVLTVPLAAAGLAVSALIPSMDPIDHVIGAAVGYASLAGLALLYRRLRGREGLGRGDAKLFAAAGAWLGWQGLASVLLLGATSGLAWAMLTLRSRRDAHEPLPFGPFLALGAWLTWILGPLGLS